MQIPLRRSLVILGVGAAGALTSFGLAFLAFPRTRVTTDFLWPGIQLMPLLSQAVPDGFAYWLVPGGGAPAGLAIALFGSLLAWGLGSVVLWSGCRHALHFLRPVD